MTFNKQKYSKTAVSASDVGRAAFCPQYLVLKNRNAQVSKSAQMAREKGNKAHYQFNKAANDRRCFIASHLYGADHFKTNDLREFRDKTLLKTFIGKMLVSSYYKTSPMLVRISENVPLIHWFFKKTIDTLHSIIRRK